MHMTNFHQNKRKKSKCILFGGDAHCSEKHKEIQLEAYFSIGQKASKESPLNWKLRDDWMRMNDVTRNTFSWWN